MAERMQVLLSRAAEEQLAEQRQVSLVLTDLRQLVTGLGEQLNALREKVEDLSGQVGAVSVPSADAVAAAVADQTTDRLVDGLAERVRATTTDSERRITTHVDEAVLALAEALLRRRRGIQAGVLAAVSVETSEGNDPGPQLRETAESGNPHER